jgi:hypothetical protein
MGSLFEELKSLDWKKILLTSTAISGLISASAIASYWYGTRQIATPTQVPQTSQIPETPETTPTIEPEPEPEQATPTQVKPPKTFGYTNPTDLHGIGIRASFPKGATISYYDPTSSYTATMGKYDTVNLSLQNYSGGGRRDWFLANHGWPNNTFKPFTANNHSGYVSYHRDSAGKISGPFFYFTVVRSDKMLLITSYDNTNSVYFFAKDLERFKSFLSTVQTTEPNLGGVDPSRKQKDETRRRWSDMRQTVWESSDLGLKITAPEWSEHRVSENEEWMRMAHKAQVLGNTIWITDVMTYPRLEILDDEYIGKSFKQVIEGVLPGAGFCNKEWKESKTDCESPDYCYTRDEVVQNFILKETIAIGSLQAQRWALRADFSWENDCRSQNEWLIRTKNGGFIVTNVYPSGNIIRIESL